MSDQREVFRAVKGLLEKSSAGLRPTPTVIDSKAKGNKRQYHLYGKKDVSIVGRKPQPTYFAGVIEQKHFVGFYFMPIYSHLGEFDLADGTLKPFLKGKSCFNLKKLDALMKKELAQLIKQGKKLYKSEGWI